ncbi:MAG: peptide chain release factor 2 [Paludibacteraceae bacterium]
MITQDQLKEMLERELALRRYLDIDAKLIQIEEEEIRTQAPDFWNDTKKAEAQMKKVKDLKKWVEGYNEVKSATDELQLAFDFFKEEVATEEEVDNAYKHVVQLLETIEMKNMLSAEEDQLGAVLKIVSGAGGTEAQDWAEMLFRMYQRWCERQGYKCEVSNYQGGDEAGIKTVTIQIEGDMAFGYLKSENGVHRLVRVSPYNAQGKRMTSFSSVFVVPLVDDSIQIEVNPANLSWDTFRSSGAGGQNVNKVETGVRLHYKYFNELAGEEQEIVIENTESRSQLGNRENALRLLRSQLYEIELEKRRTAQAKVEAGKKKIEWGSQIRSYVFDDRRVKDHRTNYQTSDVNGVMDGNIDEFIKAYLMEFGREEKQAH